MRFSIGIYPNGPAQETIATAELADRLGYSCVWVLDSHLLFREVYALLGAIAVKTRRIRLGSAVTNPMTRHMTVTASAFSTLDELSGGRASLGISVGDSALKAMGLPICKVDDFAAALATIRALLAGRSVKVAGGDEARVTHAKDRMVPIYVGATGPRMLKLSGATADGVILMNGVAPDLLKAAIDLVHQGAREANRDPAAVKILVWSACHANGANPAESIDAVKFNVARAILRGMPGPIDELTKATAERVRKAYDYAQHGTAEAEFAALVPSELVPRYAFAGTPQDIKNQVDRLKDLGVDEITFAVPRAPGITPRDKVLELLAKQFIR
jgi:5,10-methylenetetrahydromethanopterin reductase